MFAFEKICCVYDKVILYRKCCDSFHVTFYLFAVPAFISVYGLILYRKCCDSFHVRFYLFAVPVFVSVYGLVYNSRALGFTE